MRSPSTAVMPFCLGLMVLLLTLRTSGVNSQDTADSGCESLTNSSSCCANTECAFYTSCTKDPKQVCMNVNATKVELKAKCGVDTAQDTCQMAIAGECESQNASTCCDHEGCQYITCFSATNPANKTSGCYNETDTAKLNTTCSQGSDRNNSCSAVVRDVCTDSADNRSTCCGVEGCAWVNCTKEAQVMKSGICTNSTQMSGCQSGETAVDTCLVAPSSTEAPQTTSSTQTPSVVCTGFTKSEDCCKESNTCGWINCTSTDGQAQFPKCLQKVPSEISKVCKETTDVNLCIVPIGTTTTTTAAPQPTPSSKTGQHFDGASFVGGMILAFGIVALIYFGCKCYKAKQERNYHTL